MIKKTLLSRGEKRIGIGHTTIQYYTTRSSVSLCIRNGGASKQRPSSGISGLLQKFMEVASKDDES